MTTIALTWTVLLLAAALLAAWQRHHDAAGRGAPTTRRGDPAAHRLPRSHHDDVFARTGSSWH